MRGWRRQRSRMETQDEKARRQNAGVLPNEEIEAVLDRIAHMDLSHQIQLIRMLLPDVLEKLTPVERQGFVRELAPSGELQ